MQKLFAVLALVAMSNIAFAQPRALKVPADAFVPKVLQDMEITLQHIENGTWLADEVPVIGTACFEWAARDPEFEGGPLVHCARAPDFLSGTNPPPVIDTAWRYRVFNHTGEKVLKEWLVAVVVDGVLDESNVEYTRLGELTGSPLGSYLMVVDVGPGGSGAGLMYTARPDFFELPADEQEAMLTTDPLSVFLTRADGSSGFTMSYSVISEDGESFTVVADATAIEYGLVSVLLVTWVPDLTLLLQAVYADREPDLDCSDPSIALC